MAVKLEPIKLSISSWLIIVGVLNPGSPQLIIYCVWGELLCHPEIPKTRFAVGIHKLIVLPGLTIPPEGLEMFFTKKVLTV